MTSIRITTAALLTAGLVATGAMAQDKAGGGATGATNGAASPAGAAGGGALRQPDAAQGGAGAPRPASPGLAPAGSAQPAPGARNAGENAGESPVQKPGVPGAAGGQGKPDPAAVEGQPAGRAGEVGQPNNKPGQAQNGQSGAGKPAAGARPAPKVTQVQETKIRQSFKTVDVHPVTVNFNIGVGVAVPTTVALRPLPPTIIDVVPGYEGYRFFVAPGQIVIVDPISLEIVAVLPL